MIQTLLIAAGVSLVAYVYSQILTQPDMLLNRVHNHVDRYWPKWLAYPVLVCMKCVSGQMAFWYYLIKFRNDYIWDQHILFVAFAIFLSLFYDKAFKWLTKK